MAGGSERAALRLVSVGKSYSRRGPAVLAGVDLSLPRGVVVHVRGGNGSGKSTLLRVIAGVTSPSRGAVRGRPRGVGYVPERFPPAVRFTSMQYLRHMARVRRSTPERGRAMLDELGGAELADVAMTELSKGSCQKVACAQALMGDPALLVLDEAWTGLDAAAQAVLDELVRVRCELGNTVVLTDHARGEAAVTADLHWLVADGRVTEEPAPAPSRVPGPLVGVELAGGADRAVPAGLPGVVRAHAAAGGMRLEVESDHCDALLAEVLRAGWSVRCVGPAA